MKVQSPLAVREALSSAFQNVYAEGYPDEFTRFLSEGEILNYDVQLAHYRRYSDPRYYKGVEYADTIEELARRRCAEAFASNGVKPDDIFVNVQPLSGGPANNAVYHALVNPGDTIMGMNLLHGGHLSHGSRVNRSGKYYNAIHYQVDADTEQINYDRVGDLAGEHKPKFIIAGYSSYPWKVDWGRFREIADSVGAYLFADIAHVAGLVAAGVYPSPIGFADVITFTTHKSLCGPRGACVLTTKPSLARKLDRAVFPGEQGGPHINVFAAMALAFKLAQTEHFRKLQSQIITNCVTFTQRLEERGFRIPFGGTNTHLMNLDCSSVKSEDGISLSGDQAARILDLVGVVVNRNTIPGDKSAANPSGIRMGTSWVTQRGFGQKEILRLADIIADVLFSTKPYVLPNQKRTKQRAKVDFAALQKTKIQVRELALSAGIDYEPTTHHYPHFYYIDDYEDSNKEIITFEIGGERIRSYLNFVFDVELEQLSIGAHQPVSVYTPKGRVEGIISTPGDHKYHFTVHGDHAGLAASWLRSLSDGYVEFDQDICRKIPGPVWVRELVQTIDSQTFQKLLTSERKSNRYKPYYIGISEESSSRPRFFTKIRLGRERTGYKANTHL